ncbi:aspartate kinase [Parvularcula bermudensis]
MKFGGTSVKSIDRIERVARHVMAGRAAGYKVCVNVSAMAGETDRLVDLATSAFGNKAARMAEYDTVVSTGEQVTAGLLSLVLQRHGIAARSWLGWQLPFQTDARHGAATIHEIDTSSLGDSLEAGEVAVVAGFQGIDEEGRITTLGRGGSDTSAVALAIALNAGRCDIYTDVDGVYTSDPRIVPSARRLDQISYEEMLEMASLGAKVLQTRSVGLAMRYGVPLRVLSSLGEPGESKVFTQIMSEQEIMERRVVSAVVPSRSEARVDLLGVPDKPGVSAMIFTALAAAKVNIDMIIQSQSRDSASVNLSFTLKEQDLSIAQSVLAERKSDIGYTEILADQNVAKVSIIGVGMNDRSGVAAQMFETLSSRGINILNISTSEIKISVLVSSEYTELAVRALHDSFGLRQSSA